MRGFRVIKQEVVDEFNNHFFSFFWECVYIKCSFHFTKIHYGVSISSDVEFYLHSLLFGCNRRKPAGFDTIAVSDLSKKFYAVKHIFLSILNGIIDSGVFPSSLKIDVVKLLFKGGNKYGNVSSYRPISVTSCILQIFEKHILNIITSFLDKFGLISPHQFGFV